MSDISKKIKEKKEFFGKSGKMGTYTVVMALFLLAALVIVNLIVSALPNTFTQFDTSRNKIYTLSSSTKTFIAGLDEDVTLYFVCEGGSELATVRTFLDRYSAQSSRIKVKVADPVKEPKFLAEYNAESCSNYSVIAVSGERYKLVDYADMFYYYNDTVGQVDASTYEYYMNYYGDYFSYYYGDFVEYFNGDASITGAIEYVVAEKVPTVYTLSGHNEADFSSLITTNLQYAGITFDSVNIAIGDDEIPDDCDVIIINVPANDITASEAEKLMEYFDNGGKIILFTQPGCDDFTNLNTFTAHCGLSAVSGTVTENDSGMYYPRYQQIMYPDVNSDHDATSDFALSYASSYPALIGYAHGIELTGADGVTVTSLMDTSSKATTDEDDTARQYSLAAAAEKGDGKLIWIGSAYMLDDTFISASNYGNFYCFYIMFNWMQTAFETGLPDIEAIDLTEPTLTVSSGAANFCGSLLIFVIPLAVIVGGLAYWLVRRKK